MMGRSTCVSGRSGLRLPLHRPVGFRRFPWYASWNLALCLRKEPLAMNDEIQDLNSRVSEAIFFAGRSAPDSQEAQDAYRRVSALEEQIARLTTPTDVDGAVARVGAVSAALRAGDWLRASRL